MNINTKKSNSIIALFICICTVIQILFYITNKSLNETDNNKSDNSTVKMKNISLKELDNELLAINNINIIKENLNGDEWNISLMICDTSKKVIEALEKLNKYKINNYNMEFIGENINLYLELTTK